MSTYTNITPFTAAKVASMVLAQEGIDVEVRPQMMYSYAKKGLIASNYNERVDGEKVYFNGDAFKAWLDKYVDNARNGITGSKVDYELLAQEFSAVPVEPESNSAPAADSK
jgi:hypothetical protein